MSSTTALVPYPFEWHHIRVSTDEHGEAWFAAVDVAIALGQHPISRALNSLPEEDHCLHSQEGPGSEGCTFALISERGLLRILLRSDSLTAWKMRRWLTHEVLPAIQRSLRHATPEGGSTIEAIRRQTAAEVLRKAEEIIDLTGVSHAQALLSALERIQTNGAATEEALQGACCLPRHASPEQGGQLERSQRPHAQPVPAPRPAIAWLTADQVAERLHCTLRGTNQRLADTGLQVRNDEDDWQITEAGRDWGVALPLCSGGERRQRILWDPAVMTLLEGEHR